MIKVNKLYVKRIVSVITMTGVIFSMTGCSNKIKSANLMENVNASVVEKKELDELYQTNSKFFGEIVSKIGKGE